MRHLQLVVLPLLCSTAACFVKGRETPVPAPSTTASQAVEVGCPYSKASSVKHMVTLSFVVLTDGSVAPSSIKFTPDHHDTDDPGFVQRAKEIAQGCTFKPALSNGEPIESTIKKRFYFNED